MSALQELPIRDQLIERMKAVLRPVVRHRTLLEKAKYFGTTVLDPQIGNDRIADLLREGKPRALGKIGDSELGGLRRYELRKGPNGICERWGRHRSRLNVNAGVYPADDTSLSRFCTVYSQALGDLDILAVWYHRGERRLASKFAPTASMTSLTSLEPFYHQRPWSSHLLGKRVLVISPFADTIRSQYLRRASVWRHKPDVLPEFELDTLRCPLSSVLVKPLYENWFAALEAMKQQMDGKIYDVLIIGAGAWSLPLASHAKRQGKWAIHLGGGTQLLFGIRGKRWDDNPFLQTMYNDAWVRPGTAERPQTLIKIENGCYW